MHQTNFVIIINLCCKSKVCSYVYFSYKDNDMHMFEKSIPQETFPQVLTNIRQHVFESMISYYIKY